MRKSKLETYEDILEALVSKPLTIEKVAYETDMDCATAKRRMEFLTKNELVQERPMGKKKCYAITERGISVLKALNFQKYLDKIVGKLRMIDEALQILPSIAKDAANQEKTED